MASKTEYGGAGAVIGRYAAVDVVRFTARSIGYNRSVAGIGRFAAFYVVRSTATSTEY